MKFRTLTCITAMTVFAAALAIPVRLAAQEQQNKQQPRYKLVDLGTFGGPTSYGSASGSGNQVLNNAGLSTGYADTSTPDPFAPNCFNPDCFVSHTFRWQDGVLTDLGALPGTNGSAASGINARGWIAGTSENGVIDPLIGIPEDRAVLWQHGQIINLGTLGGYESVGVAVNGRNQVVGFATNTIPDPFGLGTQVRTFLWENGVMRDLGTLGGPDAFPAGNIAINEGGQVAGSSFTSSNPNSVADSCGQDVPTEDPFLWENGKIFDLGGLGGTCGFPISLNKRGQVVGQSDLAGDSTFHPFLWTKPGPMQDLGTLGGDTGTTNWINDAGEIAGKANLGGPAPQNHHATLWKNGAITDLGTLSGDSCSNAYQVNSRGQVVGTSENQTLCLVPTGEHAFLWENGGPMVDLNTLVPPGSSLQLTFALSINDRGEIAGTGLPPGCAPENIDTCGHAYLLIPNDGDEGCSQGENPTAATTSTPAAATLYPTPASPASRALSDGPTGVLDRFRARRLPGLGTMGPATGTAN